MEQLVLRVLAVVFALAGLVLGSVVVWVDLDTADRVASVAGACVGFVGCALSLYLAVRQVSRSGHVVQASGPGAVAAAGNAVGNATGKNATVTRRVTAAPVNSPSPVGGQHEVTASGPGSLAAAGDASSNATGEGSNVEER
ncbi:hypothetical protein [Streptomyces europaeiscabiei]|uniref:hypothetical protein n=1 Tax=Streptomyces europaeiscabiei TaxID=146819 RepID=UPI0029A35291|nr:hypothetical protein [Streptomyces europaeiscabiei]MDX3589073.1 hypothetical protein [Streptomyces europaeiscabiei]